MKYRRTSRSKSPPQLGEIVFVVVEDIAKEGALDEVVNGVNTVELVTSPVHKNAADPKEMIVAVVKGPAGALESVNEYGSAR
ncbi:hypothetical protein PM082_014646 [Marasmius tenuissimus]|nr:hypothetical protein PM082_014646 [Marasmius tenuissimus]